LPIRRDTNPNGYCNADPNSYCYGNGNRHCHRYANGYGNCDGDRYTKTYSLTKSHPISEGAPNASSALASFSVTLGPLKCFFASTART
jgi:hypothetical protein